MTGQIQPEYLASLSTQTETLPVKTSKRSLVIGMPKELDPDEKRIGIIPEAVQVLVARGNEVYVETGAGGPAKYTDREYSEAGAQIVYSPQELYKNCSTIVKISPPNLEEIAMIQQSATLISAVQLSSISGSLIQALMEKRITAVAFETLEDESNGLPVVRAMSEIAGSTVMLIAAEYMNSNNNGRGIILGGVTGVPPSKVVIIGAGTAAEYAARTALGLGAEVKIFDTQIYKLRRIRQELGHNIYTSLIDHANLEDALKRADVVIGALRTEDGVSPCVVSAEQVSIMKPNSIIIDVSIDQGGCFETSRVTTHANPTYVEYDVIHYCVPNIASRVAHSASIALSNILSPVLSKMAEMGGVEELIFEQDWFMKGVYTYKGNLTSRMLAKRLNMRYKDMNLFRLARI